jgi:hypothetical protein
MKQIYLIVFMLFALFSTGLFAQTQSGVEVDNIAICSSIENKQPVGTDSVFTADVGKLYCFTKLISQLDTSEVSHVWFFEDKEMTKVALTMKAKSWRTWSAKTILPEWKGNWRVEVRDSADKVITRITFKVK